MLSHTKSCEEEPMLRSMKDMEDYAISATDGIIGRVADFYFDDEGWAIRYLVVKLEGGDAPGDRPREVLISPISIGTPDWKGKLLPVSLTQRRIRSSPGIDTEKPVSRQQEMGYLGYFGYGRYWGGGGLWGAGLYPDVLQAGLEPADAPLDATADSRDTHLRSGNAVMRYYVHASDGDIGHVAGFLVEEKSWAIRYLIVDTSNWWLGHQVIIPAEKIDGMSWTESTVSVSLTRGSVKHSPPYDGSTMLERAAEEALHHHYVGESPRSAAGRGASALMAAAKDAQQP
jgi:hypothetical protein